jgi:dTDP-4-amino-4,6-dideoxygalactose transaminase
MKRIISISKPYFNWSDNEAVYKPVKSGWIAQDKYVREFDNRNMYLIIF